MSSTEAIVIVPPRGAEPVRLRDDEEDEPDRHAERVRAPSAGPPNSASSTGSAARNDGMTIHAIFAAIERERAKAVEDGSDVTCIGGPRVRTGRSGAR